MPMIRRADREQVAREALVMNLGDILREGETAIAEARAEAARILAEARAERERLLVGAAEEGRREGMERGLEEGRKAGEAEGAKAAAEAHRAALQKIEESWNAALESFESQRAEMLAMLRRDGLALALDMAGRIVKRVVELDEQVATRQLEAALAVLARPTRLTVAIHPEDRSTVESALPALLVRFQDATHAEIVVDPTVGRGGCVVRAASGGVIDATVESQLRRLIATLGGESAAPAVEADESEVAAQDAAPDGETPTLAGERTVGKRSAA